MNGMKLRIAVAILLIFSAVPIWAAAPAPPTQSVAVDAPGDTGTKVDVRWKLSPDDTADAEPRRVISYQILRKIEGDENFEPVGEATYQKSTFTDGKCKPGSKYFYQILAVGPDGAKSEPAETTEAAVPDLEYFDTRLAWFGIILLVVCGSVIYFIEMARGGKDLKIRKIAGLEAVDEAVGRATEMGRTCLFIPGITDINDIQTLAGLTVLSRVATLTAEYNAKLEVPTCRSLVMTIARETVEASYLGAGRPDAYNEDDIYYLTDEQFGYVAGVMGTMVRDKPAACFYMGAFYAESLLLAETGNSIGAIQVAGTAMPSQLPFFVAACDYTLIGEEFFAASAYLSGDVHQLGSLKGQDVGKVFCAVMIVSGCLLATAVVLTGNTSLGSVVTFITDNILGREGFLP